MMGRERVIWWALVAILTIAMCPGAAMAQEYYPAYQQQQPQQQQVPQAQPQVAPQQWTLTVYLHPSFGTDKVYVEAYGPFGAHEGQWFSNGVNAYATLTLQASDFPQGYQYKIGIGSGFLGSLFTKEFSTTATGYDMTYKYVNSGDVDHLYGPLTQQQQPTQQVEQPQQQSPPAFNATTIPPPSTGNTTT